MSVKGRRTVSRAGYAAYIQSDAWRAVRRRFWASKLPKTCFICGADPMPGMHLHHRTYKNLGNEMLKDIVPTCPGCHEEIHRLYESDPKWRAQGLWGVTKALRKRRGGGRVGMAKQYKAKGHQLPRKFIEKYGEDGRDRPNRRRRAPQAQPRHGA